MTTNETEVQNRYGDHLRVGDEVDVFSRTAAGVEGGVVEAVYLRRGRWYARVRQAGGAAVVELTRNLVPKGAVR